jgi:DNA-binding IclR family transcriptional regulator
LLWLAANEGATASEAAAALSWPVPTTYRLLTTLAEEGLVAKDEGKRYRMGLRVGILSDAFLREHSVPQPLKEGLESLAAATAESAYLVGWRGDEIRVLHSVEGAQAVRVAAITSGPYPDGHARATGKLLLAFANPARRAAYLAQNPVRPVTERTIVDRQALAAEFEAIVRNGYAVDEQEFVTGVGCVSGPIFDEGELVAAYTVSAPIERYRACRDELIAEVQLACRRAERGLGLPQHGASVTPVRSSPTPIRKGAWT